jgi:hypothetical protein
MTFDTMNDPEFLMARAGSFAFLARESGYRVLMAEKQ